MTITDADWWPTARNAAILFSTTFLSILGTTDLPTLEALKPASILGGLAAMRHLKTKYGLNGDGGEST